MVKKSHNAQKIGKQAEKIKKLMPVSFFQHNGFSGSVFRQSPPHPDPQHLQRRNVVAGHGPAGGAVADVADYGERACRPPGRGRRAGWTGGDRVAPPTGTQIAPRWGRQGGGMPPLLGRSPHATLAHSGGHRRGWSVRPGSRHGLSTDYFRK